MKYSTLCFGNRPDAGTWEKGCQNMGITCGKSVRSPLPSMEEIKSFFASQGNWLFFGGHFLRDALFNDGEYYTFDMDGDGEANDRRQSKEARVTFKDNEQMVAESGYDYLKFSKHSPEFNLNMSAKIILWGGCSTLNSERRVKKMANFFNGVLSRDLLSSYGIKEPIAPLPTAAGQPAGQVTFKEAPFKPAASSTRYSAAMLGFNATTGWQIVDHILGGSEPGPNSFFGRIKNKDASQNDVIEAWLAVAIDGFRNNNDVLRRVVAVDADGQQWKIAGDKIVPGFQV
jgi:hypothetical protein